MQPEEGKSGTMRHLVRWWALYQAIAFVVLIPWVSYYVATHGLPRKILLFVIPGYVVLALGFYNAFKGLKPK